MRMKTGNYSEYVAQSAQLGMFLRVLARVACRLG